MHASSKILWNLVRGLGALGFDPEPVVERLGFTLEDLEVRADEDSRISVDTLARFWDLAVEVTGDASIGVRIGALARLDLFEVLGDVARSSATLAEALFKTSRYIELWSDGIALSLLVEGDRAQISYRSHGVPRHYCSGDLIMTALLVLSRELAGLRLVPSEARFAHARPANRLSYLEVFGVDPTFESGDCAMVFPPEFLMVPVLPSGSPLSSLPVDSGDPPASFGLARKVKRVLTSELRGGNPMMDNVAAQLGVHPKTLTRRLRQEGTTHSELLDSTRRDLAWRYLSLSGLGVTEVAFLLGFSDASAFNKAFRRWFGEAPQSFRARTRR